MKGCWKVLGLGVGWKEENSPNPGDTREREEKRSDTH